MLRNYLFILLHILLLLYLLGLYYYSPKELTVDFLSQMLIIASLGIAVFFFKYESSPVLKGQFLRISYLFLLGFFLVHFQIYLDYVLGNYFRFGHDYLIDKSIVSKASVISVIALYCFNLGYLFSVNKISSKTYLQFKPKYAQKGIFIITVCLFLAFLGLMPSAYFKGQYGQIEVGYLPTILQSYLLYSILGYIIVCAYNTSREDIAIGLKRFLLNLGWPMITLICFYLVLVIISGDRGPIFQIALVVFGGHLYISKKKYKLYQILGMALLAIFILAFMGFARTLREEKSYVDRIKNAASVQETYSGMNSISPNTMELAGVVRTHHAAVSYLENHDYFYGVFQFFQIVAIIPGLGSVFMNAWDLEPAEMNSAVFLSQQILGPDAHGLGTTCVADIYLDFGLVGVLMLFIYFGGVIRRQELNMFVSNNISLFALILVLIFFSKAIYIGRSSIIIMFKDAFLTYFITMFGIYIGKFLKNTNN